MRWISTLVRLFAAVGRHDELRAAIEDRFGGLSDTVSLTTPTADADSIPPDLIEELRTIPTPFTGFTAAA